MGTSLLERKTGRCLKDRVINKPNTVRDGVAPAGVFGHAPAAYIEEVLQSSFS